MSIVLNKRHIVEEGVGTRVRNVQRYFFAINDLAQYRCVFSSGTVITFVFPDDTTGNFSFLLLLFIFFRKKLRKSEY